MKTQAEKFNELFCEARKNLPDRQVFFGWIVFCLGMLTYGVTDLQLDIMREEMFRAKKEVRH